MGINYGRGIIKQVEELTLENERLICENSCLREENKELRAKITTIESAMAEAITKLTTEIDRLKAQINKNSGNSSKPPSQDGFRQIYGMYNYVKISDTLIGLPWHKRDSTVISLRPFFLQVSMHVFMTA